jgi:hypothetical protein
MFGRHVPYRLQTMLRFTGRVLRVLLLLAAACAPGQLPPPPRPRREQEVQMVGAPEAEGQR